MNALTLTDSYKLSHKGFMEPGTELIYSNMTARSAKHLDLPTFDGKVVVYGLQHTLIDVLVDQFDDMFFKLPKDLAVGYAGRLFGAYVGSSETKHFEDLYELGYLPIEVKALPEGTLCPLKVPMYTLKNTHPNFAWLTNYLETVMSAETWKAPTVATIIYHYRKLINEFAMKTTGSTEGTEFQLHDFSFRGMSNRHDAAKSGSAFLLSSCGTDNIPALPFIARYYATTVEDTFLAASVPASEHSLASTGIAVRGELEMLRKWITEDYPTGIVSVISDTFDFWKVITEYAPALKDEIEARKTDALGLAKVVFRPDSGDPVKIVTGYKVYTGLDVAGECAGELDNAWNHGFDAVLTEKGEYFELETVQREGKLRAALGRQLQEHEVKGAIQCLYEIFGGTKTEQGYIVLNPRVGLIYGDSMNYQRIEAICQRLAAKGFASTNVVFGIGSYTMQYMTRDTLGMAVKATYAEVDGKGYELFKDPATDDGTKKSAKGLLRVDYNENGEIALFDQQTKEQEEQGLLRTVFKDGVVSNLEMFTDIRERLWEHQ
jgi:nicotinamide phosphoribosyltransferase